MATKDIVLLNLTSSKLEAQQSTDTARIRGNSDLLLSVEDASYNQILTVNTNTSEIGTPAITASGEISMSATGSFGRVNATYFRGDGSNLTYALTADHVSSSVQLSANISGSWQGDLSQSEFTYPEYLAGEESGLTFVSGGLTGSVSSTASFGRIETGKVTGDGSQMTNWIPNLTISSSTQIAKSVSGSWQNSFSSSNQLNISGGISSSSPHHQFSASFWGPDGTATGKMNNNIKFTASGSNHPLSASTSWSIGGWFRSTYGDVGYGINGREILFKVGDFNGWLQGASGQNAFIVGAYWVPDANETYWSALGLGEDTLGSGANSYLRNQEWHHLTFTVNGTTGSVFLDGTQITQSSIVGGASGLNTGPYASTMSINQDTPLVYLGTGWTAYPFGGALGTWGMWSEGLSSSAAPYLFNDYQGAELDINDPSRGYTQAHSLIGWWKLGETGSFNEDVSDKWSFADSSGNNFTGSNVTANKPGPTAITSSGYGYKAVPVVKSSFDNITAKTFTGDGSQLTSVIHKGIISSSDAFAERTIMGMDTGSGVNLISGSWQSELSSSSDLFVSGGISGSSIDPQFSSSFYLASGIALSAGPRLAFDQSGSHHVWPLSASSTWTVGGWYKADPGLNTSGRVAVWRMGTQTGTQHIWLTRNNGSADGHYLTVTTGDGAGGDQVLSFTSQSGERGDPNDTTYNRIKKVEDGQWHQFFISAEQSTGSLFLDGEFITSSLITSKYNIGGGTTMSLSGDSMGINPAHWYWTPQGNHGTWACWNHALSASSAEVLYNQGLSKDFTVNERGYQQASDLVGWWKLGESSSFGETVANRWEFADSSGNNFTGSSTVAKTGVNAISSSGVLDAPRFTSTVGRVEATSITGDGTFYRGRGRSQGLMNVLDLGIISSSTVIAPEVTGSWQGEFSSSAQLFISGGISSSAHPDQYTNDYAMDFDGSADYIIASIDGTRNGGVFATNIADFEFTIALWVKLSSNVTDGIFQWSDRLASGTPFLYIKQVVDSTGAGTDILVSVDNANHATTTITLNEWHYIVIKRDNSNNTWSFYADNVEWDTRADSGTAEYQSSTRDMYLGHGYHGYMDGQIADVAVWNTSMDPSGSTDLYNNGYGKPSNEISSSNLVAWWRMGDGATFDGTNWTIPDASDGARHPGRSVSMAAAARVKPHDHYARLKSDGARLSRVEANTLSGDGSQLKGIFTQGELSSSAQIAQDITGSTHWGHTLTSSLDTKVGQLDQNVSAVGSPVFSDVIVSGSVKAAKMVMTSSVSHYSSSKGSGSAVFGDSTGDLHSFTGSLQVGRTYQNKYAMTFNRAATNYIDCGDINIIDGASVLTIAVWIKASATDSTLAIVGKRTDNNNRMHIYIGDDRIYWNVSNGGSKYGHSAFTRTDWAHLVMVFDGSGADNASRLKGYVDGAAQSLSFAGTIATTLADHGTNAFTIGTQLGVDWAFDGQIGEVALWDTALTADQAGDLFNVTSSGFNYGVPSRIRGEHLQGWWLMGDGAIQSGSVGWEIPDMSGKGFTGGTVNMNETSRSLGFYSGSRNDTEPLMIPQGHVRGVNYIPSGDRGVMHLANWPSTNTLEYITISSTGNSTDFGDLAVKRSNDAKLSNGANDRGIIAAGKTGPIGATELEYITISTTGNAIEYGVLTHQVTRYRDHNLTATSHATATSNGPNERGLIFGGVTYSTTNTTTNSISSLTISTLADSEDFGDGPGGIYMSAGSNGVNDRAIIATNSATDGLQYVTISTSGNSISFGDPLAGTHKRSGFVSNATNERGVYGEAYPASNQLEYITFSSLGDATDFGDKLTDNSRGANATGNAQNQRAVWYGGYGSSPTTNVMEYLTISTTGNSVDFGDLLTLTIGSSGDMSNASAANIATGSFTEWTGDGSGLTFSSDPTSASFSDPLRAFRAHGSNDPVFGFDRVGAATGSLIIPSGITGNTSGASGSRFSNQGRISSQGGSTLLRHNIQAENTAFEAHFSSASAAQWRSGSISASYAAETLESGSAHLSGSSAGPAPQHGSLTHQFVEAWDGLNWIVFATGSAQVGQRGVIITNDTVDDIEYVTLSNPGNAANFGNQTNASKSQRSATSNGTNGRGLFGGGAAPGNISVIDYVTISTPSDATAFGDLSVARGTLGAISNGTNDRAVFGGGTDRMDYVTISTSGNAAIFGTLQALTIGTEGTSNGTDERGIFGGTYPAANATIEFITIFNVSDAADFGDLVVAAGTRASFSNDLNQRGIFAGGTAPAAKADIDYVTISTVGNAADFGDLTEVNAAPGGLSSGTNDRGIVFGDSPVQKTIQYITISTPGNATDFGRLREAKADAKGTSNSAK